MQASGRPMITQMIFDWAKRTPDRTAIVHNGRPYSYQSFAQLIGTARGYFARRGYSGPGYAMLAVHNLLDFWVVSLALRSLGLTTMAVEAELAVRNHRLPSVRCVVAAPGETWAGLDTVCSELGLPLLSVSLAGEAHLGLEDVAAAHPLGGHILRTSGTTGIRKMVLMSPADDTFVQRLQSDVFGMNQHSLLCLFDFGAWTGHAYKWAISTWSVGGAIVIEQGREAYRALLYPGVTHAVLNPLVLAGILAAPADAFPRNDSMQVAVGAGALTRMHVEQAKARITPRIFNYVASTEAGIISFTPLDTPEQQRWHRLVPGRAVEIVNDTDRPVPAGAIGRMRSQHGGRAHRLFQRRNGDAGLFQGRLLLSRRSGRHPIRRAHGAARTRHRCHQCDGRQDFSGPHRG